MPALKKVTWDEISPTIQFTNPDLKETIDTISPSKDYSLYVGEYPYGALILDKGIFKVINNDNELVPLVHSSVDGKVQRDLDYTGTIPVGMVLENSIETCFILPDRTVPSSFYTKGGMVSLWSVLEGGSSYQIGPLWSITSGARTVCMLPKITDKYCYEELKRKYNLKEQIPQSLVDHWRIFERIANHKEFSQPWKSKILFFSKKWFEHTNDKKWNGFYHYLLNMAWNDSTVKRNQFIFDFIFSLVQKNRALKPNPYLADTVKHLFMIGAGGLPGFKPATDNVAAPVTGFQRTYIEDYGLRKIPTIMQPHHFSGVPEENAFYSFEMPTTTTFSPRSSNGVSRMVDMREVKYIMEILISEIICGNLMVEKTPFYNLAKKIQYTFYHTDPDQHSEITQIKNISEISPDFRALLCDTKSTLTSTEFSPFFRGCILLSVSN